MRFLSVISVWAATAMVAAAMAAGLAGCTSAKEFLRADTASFEISAEDTSDHAIIVEASSSWIVNAADKPDWLTLWYDASEPEPNPNLLWVRAAVNEEIKDRATEIIIVSGDGRLLAIPFKQLAMVVRFGVSPGTLEPFTARDAGTQTLDVDTALAWEFEQLHGDWITMTPGAGEEGGPQNTLEVGVRPTRIFEERRDTIVLRPVRADYWDYADSIAVVQAGIDLVMTGETLDEETLEIAVPAEGGVVPLSVSSRYGWTLTTDAPADRVQVNLTSHEGDTIETGTPIEMTVAPNPSTEEDYTFALTIESAGETYEYQCRQSKSNPPNPEPNPEQEQEQEPNP
jgi:hypothetical protein